MKSFKYSWIFLGLAVYFVLQPKIFAQQDPSDPGLPDSVIFECIDYYLDDSSYQGKLKVPIAFFNDEVLTDITIPLIWSGPLLFDSATFVGSRVEEIEYYKGVAIDSLNNKLCVWVLIQIGDFVPPGRGLLSILYFSIIDTGYVEIDTTFFPPGNYFHFSPEYAIAFEPQFTKLQLHLEPSLAGDVNQDGSADVVDVVFMINYLFKNGLPPCCSNCTDVNADCEMTVSDAVYLINYLFRSGTPPQVGCVLPF